VTFQAAIQAVFDVGNFRETVLNSTSNILWQDGCSGGVCCWWCSTRRAAVPATINIAGFSTGGIIAGASISSSA
jgi:hypothetical protein